MMVPDDSVDAQQRSRPMSMTRRERRRRIWLLVLLLLLLALLSYATYYYTQNRSLPLVATAPTAAVEPPQFLYSIVGQDAAQMKTPIGIAVAQDGRVFVADLGNRRISVFTNAGEYIESFNELSDGKILLTPVHMWIRGQELWVTDRTARTIEVFDLAGEHLRTFEADEELADEWSPLAIALDAEGNVRVSDVGVSESHRVHYFDTAGDLVTTFGRTYASNAPRDEPGGFSFPNGIAIAPGGDVYIADGNNGRVQVFDDAGTFKTFVDTSGLPRGLAIDAQERLYVVDALAHTVDVYELDGSRLTQFGTRGIGPGQFNYPNDIAVDARRKIYITDRENNQVQVWGWPLAVPPIAGVVPDSRLGWAACLAPLLLLPLLLLARKKRIVVTPDFVEYLISMGHISAVSLKRRLRLVAPEQDGDLYRGRVEQGVELEHLITLEAHSESDARVYAERYGLSERDAILLAMAERAVALGTEESELRRLALAADVRVLNGAEFAKHFLGANSSTGVDME